MTKRAGAGLFPQLNLLTTGFSLWRQTGELFLGSGEVIYRRLDLVNGALRGERTFPYAEVSRMWQEKFTAAISLYFRMNQNFLNSLPLLTQGLNGSPASAKLLNEQLKGVSAMLKPYHGAVRANRKRLRGKRR